MAATTRTRCTDFFIVLLFRYPPRKIRVDRTAHDDATRLCELWPSLRSGGGGSHHPAHGSVTVRRAAMGCRQAAPSGAAGYSFEDAAPSPLAGDVSKIVSDDVTGSGAAKSRSSIVRRSPVSMNSTWSFGSPSRSIQLTNAEPESQAGDLHARIGDRFDRAGLGCKDLGEALGCNPHKRAAVGRKREPITETHKA